MTRPRPQSQPVAKPGVDPGLNDPKTPCGPGCRGEVSLLVGRWVGGPWWGHPGLSGLESVWGWGRPIVQSLRGDRASGPNLLQPRGHQEPRDSSARGTFPVPRWGGSLSLCLCLSPCVPAPGLLPRHLRPPSTSRLPGRVFLTGRRASGVLVPSLQAQQGPIHERRSGLTLGKRSGSSAPGPTSWAQPSRALPPPSRLPWSGREAARARYPQGAGWPPPLPALAESQTPSPASEPASPGPLRFPLSCSHRAAASLNLRATHTSGPCLCRALHRLCPPRTAALQQVSPTHPTRPGSAITFSGRMSLGCKILQAPRPPC